MEIELNFTWPDKSNTIILAAATYNFEFTKTLINEKTGYKGFYKIEDKFEVILEDTLVMDCPSSRLKIVTENRS
jgi:hypothetical protein